MQVHRLTTDEYEVEPLGYYATREGVDAAVLELAFAGKITRKIVVEDVEVIGDPTVIVLTDDDGRLVAGPFDDHANAGRYSPHEEFISAEWTVGRYAEALAGSRVRQELRRLLGELDAGTGVEDLRAELEAALEGGASA